MKLAVNYSRPTAALWRSGPVAFDLFKCPAWPDLAAEAHALGPVYVHFPLRVGAGIGDAMDGETEQPADWRKVEELRALTDTPFVNVHLAPQPADCPDIDPCAADPVTAGRVAEKMSHDLAAIVRRFGADRVIAENDPDNGETLRAACLPGVVRQVVEEAGCGLLLDLAHVRISAAALGLSPAEYARLLPIERLREVHVSGVQLVDTRWLDLVRRAAPGNDRLERFAGRLLDHLPMTAADWELVTWAFARIHAAAWPSPRTVTLELGGVGALWEAIGQEAQLEQTIGRLRELA